MNESVHLDVKGDKIIVNGAIRFENVVTVLQTSLRQMQTMQNITVDLSGLVDCDSSVLALCVAWVREQSQKHKKIAFINLPSFMQDLVRVHQLDTAIGVLSQHNS